MKHVKFPTQTLYGGISERRRYHARGRRRGDRWIALCFAVAAAFWGLVWLALR